MFVKRVILENYRNIAAAEVTLSPSVNLFYGKNAQGKTNFLESVYLFSQGASFRNVKERDYCRFGQNEARATLVFEREGYENCLKMSFFGDGRRKEISVNGFPIKKLSGLAGNFYTVLFAPEHLSLVKDGPSERRKFLDIAISPLKPKYAAALDEYEKILTHKNALLKDIFKFPTLRDTLPVWNEKQARAGAYIAFMRASYIEKITPLAAENHLEISNGKEALSLKYLGFSDKKEDYDTLEACKAAFLRKITETEEEEIRAGVSLCGPQRDDMEIEINGNPARSFASQGQQRSAVLSLKLAEGSAVFANTGEHPVFLLDDILSELDTSRRAYILHKIADRQVIITACDRARYKSCADMTCFAVKDGVIIKK